MACLRLRVFSRRCSSNANSPSISVSTSAMAAGQVTFHGSKVSPSISVSTSAMAVCSGWSGTLQRTSDRAELLMWTTASP